MPAWTFARQTLFNDASPACLWRHPLQALRLVAAVTDNATLPLRDSLLPARHRCPVCDWEGRNFKAFLSADEVIEACICPCCGSFDRHRLLAAAVRHRLDDRGEMAPRILVGFSLSSAMRLLLEREGAARCFRTDISPDNRFAPDLVCDLRRCGIADDSVDWILCSHVLEHVAELDQCLAEIERMLASGGLAWIQVPQEIGLARSEAQPIDPHRSHAHAWRFGDDFTERLGRPGWQVERIDASALLDAAELWRCGIDPRECYWLVRRR